MPTVAAAAITLPNTTALIKKIEPSIARARKAIPPHGQVVAHLESLLPLVLAPQQAVMGGRGEKQHRGDRGAQHGREVDVPLRRAHGGESLGERHDEQEGEEHLHPRYSNPKLVEQLEEFAVELLVAVFIGLGVTPRVTTSVFRVHTPDNLLHRLRVHNGPTFSTVGMMSPA
jgi:hypothetical protein